jgi:hypothetical protein
MRQKKSYNKRKREKELEKEFGKSMDEEVEVDAKKAYQTS